MLRRTALHGSDRAAPLDQPLGGPAFGLDSLALVSFLTALETALGVEFEPAIWTAERLTLEQLIGRIATEQRGTGAPPGGATATSLQSIPSDLGRAAPPAPSKPRLLRLTTASIGSRRRYVVLERDLALPFDVPRAIRPIEVRAARLEDAPGVAALFGPKRGERNVAELKKRIESGVLCLGAWIDGHWAGIDYVTGARHWHGFLHLSIEPVPGHAYAYGLHEGAAWRGLGVGLALIARSIELSQQSGFRRQYTIVERDNERMLSAAGQIFQFHPVGELESRGIGRFVRTTGRVRGQALRGSALAL